MQSSPLGRHTCTNRVGDMQLILQGYIVTIEKSGVEKIKNVSKQYCFKFIFGKCQFPNFHRQKKSSQIFFFFLGGGGGGGGGFFFSFREFKIGKHKIV